jgi:hypothetical protein
VKISCLTPTFGRPKLVQNAIACFLSQDYPAHLRRLLILDDAGQIEEQNADGWFVWSTTKRFDTLMAKYSKLEALDGGWADAFAIWDDDDIYLPWHLSAHAAAMRTTQWSHPRQIWSLHTGRLELEKVGRRFWASAAIRRDLHESVGGFAQSARADFDQKQLSAWRVRGGEPGRPDPPSYVYGWRRSNHCSSLMTNPSSRDWYARHQQMETGRVLRITPQMDGQTAAVYAALEKRIPPGLPA